MTEYVNAVCGSRAPQRRRPEGGSTHRARCAPVATRTWGHSCGLTRASATRCLRQGLSARDLEVQDPLLGDSALVILECYR